MTKEVRYQRKKKGHFQEDMNRRKITPHQQEVLLRLSQHKSLSVGEIASLFSISSAAATKTIQRLERKHLVIRTQDEWDRRRVLVKLTPAGQQAVNQKEKLHTL